MARDQLEHAIRTACQIIDHSEVIVVGSQSILGTYDESQLPPEATMSVEVDVLPIAATNDETARLADLIEGVAGRTFVGALTGAGLVDATAVRERLETLRGDHEIAVGRALVWLDDKAARR